MDIKIDTTPIIPMTLQAPKNLDLSVPIHVSKLYTNMYQRILIIGSSGTGKTYSLITLLPMLMVPKNLFLITRNYQQPVYKSIIDYYKSNYATTVQVIDTVADIPKFINHDNLIGTKNNIAILDDISSKDLDTDEVKDLFTQGRHLGVNVILINQSYYTVPIIIRQNLTGLCIFPLTSGLEVIFKDVRSYFKDKKAFDRVIGETILKGEKGSSLYISLEPDINPAIRIRKNYKLINQGLFRQELDKLKRDHEFKSILHTPPKPKPVGTDKTLELLAKLNKLDKKKLQKIAREVGWKDTHEHVDKFGIMSHIAKKRSSGSKKIDEAVDEALQ